MHIQIALTTEQHALVKRKTADLGISMDEYIRRLVERDLQQTGTDTDITAIFVIGDSGGSDIAIQRKRLATEAISARATAIGVFVTRRPQNAAAERGDTNPLDGVGADLYPVPRVHCGL